MKTIWEGKTLHFGKPISFTKYRIDKEMVYETKGLLSSTEEQVALYRILDISMQQDIIDKIFNQGTLVLHTSDVTRKTLILKNIGNPRGVKDILNEMIEQRKRDVRVRMGELVNYTDTGENVNPDVDDFI